MWSRNEAEQKCQRKFNCHQRKKVVKCVNHTKSMSKVKEAAVGFEGVA